MAVVDYTRGMSSILQSYGQEGIGTIQLEVWLFDHQQDNYSLLISVFKAENEVQERGPVMFRGTLAELVAKLAVRPEEVEDIIGPSGESGEW